MPVQRQVCSRVMTCLFGWRAGAEAASSTAAEAGAAVAEQLPQLLAADQNLGVRQAALLALSSVARAAGREHPDLVLAALPSALAATEDAQRAVRSSALATVAACAAALGTRLLPQLVPLVTAVLSAVEAAGNALAAAEEGQPEQAEAHDVVRPCSSPRHLLSCSINAPCPQSAEEFPV